MRRLKTLRRPPIYPKTPGHLPCSSLTHPLPLSSRRPSVSFGGFGLRGPVRRLKTVRRPPIYPKTPGHLPCSSLTHPLPLPSRRPSVSFGGFGLKARHLDTTNKSPSSLCELRPILQASYYKRKPFLAFQAAGASAAFGGEERANALRPNFAPTGNPKGGALSPGSGSGHGPHRLPSGVRVQSAPSSRLAPFP